jgi:dTDP-4-dehydrorhamnose reductase
MKVVILGSSGRLGSMVISCLNGAANTYSKIGYKGRGILHVDVEGITHDMLDISDTDKLSSLLNTYDKDTCIVNCAALTDVARIEADYLQGIKTALHVNTIPLTYLAKWSSVKDNKSIIHMSTAYVFVDGEYTYTRFNWDNVLDGCYYGETKRLAELNLARLGDNFTIVRVDNLFGGSGNVKVFIEKIIDQVYGDAPHLVVTNKQLTLPINVWALSMYISEHAIDRVTGEFAPVADVVHPMYDNVNHITYNELAGKVLRIAGSEKLLYSEDDGYPIPTGVVKRPNVVLIGNQIIADGYTGALRYWCNEYMYEKGYRQRPRKGGRG